MIKVLDYIKEHIYLIEAEFTPYEDEHEASFQSSFYMERRRVYCTMAEFNKYVKQKEAVGMRLSDYSVIYDLGIFGFDQEELERLLKQEDK